MALAKMVADNALEVRSSPLFFSSFSVVVLHYFASSTPTAFRVVLRALFRVVFCVLYFASFFACCIISFCVVLALFRVVLHHVAPCFIFSASVLHSCASFRMIWRLVCIFFCVVLQLFHVVLHDFVSFVWVLLLAWVCCAALRLAFFWRSHFAFRVLAFSLVALHRSHSSGLCARRVLSCVRAWVCACVCACATVLAVQRQQDDAMVMAHKSLFAEFAPPSPTHYSSKSCGSGGSGKTPSADGSTRRPSIDKAPRKFGRTASSTPHAPPSYSSSSSSTSPLSSSSSATSPSPSSSSSLQASASTAR
jgi:hypothetical protein